MIKTISHNNNASANLVHRARIFALNAHTDINHRRAYTYLPYIFHPIAVAKLVMSVTSDENMIAAAYLHDTVEDTPVTIHKLYALFGADVAQLVEELTDISRPHNGNRATRKTIDRMHTASISSRGKTIKLADLIDNCNDISKLDKGFIPIYVREKELLLPYLADGNKILFHHAVHMISKVIDKGDGL